jgi:hypothetical protein
MLKLSNYKLVFKQSAISNPDLDDVSYQYVHLSQWNNSASGRLTINPCQMPEKVSLKVFEEVKVMLYLTKKSSWFIHTQFIDADEL